MNKQALLKDIIEIKRDCYYANWDGYSASPISDESCNEASIFIRGLSSDLPQPEVFVDPYGTISFEWRKGKKKVFIANVAGENKIIYMGIFGDKKIHGLELFFRHVPIKVTNYIRRIYK